MLRATHPPRETEQHWGEPLKKMTPEEVARARRNFEADGRNAIKVRAAGMRLVNGTDTGQTRFWIGNFNHMTCKALMAMGMGPPMRVGSNRLDKRRQACSRHKSAGSVESRTRRSLPLPYRTRCNSKYRLYAADV
jgi:hypothetical protein